MKNYNEYEQKTNNEKSKKYIIIDNINNKQLFDKMQLIQNNYKNSNKIFVDIVNDEINNTLKNLNIKCDVK
jgi:predicted RNA-binding protein